MEIDSKKMLRIILDKECLQLKKKKNLKLKKKNACNKKKECLQQKIVSPEQAVVLDKIVEARNYASHTYDEDLACEIARQISTYAQLMNQVAQSLDVKNT